MVSHKTMIHEKYRAYKDKLEDKKPYIDMLVNLILFYWYLWKNYIIIVSYKICDIMQMF